MCRRKFLVVCVMVSVLLCVFAGCEEGTEQGNITPPPAGSETETVPGEAEEKDVGQFVEQKAEKNIEQNPEELYVQINTNMSYDEVMEVMAGHKPFMQNEGAIDTPMGQITTDNVSWKIGKSIITVIFQDKKVLGKDLSTT